MTYTTALEILSRHLGDRWINDGLIQFSLKVGSPDSKRAVEITIHDVPGFEVALIPGLTAASGLYRVTEALCREFGNDSADAMGAYADAIEAATREIIERGGQ